MRDNVAQNLAISADQDYLLLGTQGYGVYWADLDTPYSVGGRILGLAASNNVTLQNNAGDDLTISANGNFNFATALPDGSTYAVTVLIQPTLPIQTCTVSDGSGTITWANVTDISVSCVTHY